MILSYCFENKPSRATLHAKSVLPEPADPANNVIVLSSMVCFATFYSGFN